MLPSFQNPAPYTFGDTPRNNAARLRNTTGLSESFSLMRDIKTYENINIHIAFDAFNAFNRTQFATPGTSLGSEASVRSGARQMDLVSSKAMSR